MSGSESIEVAVASVPGLEMCSAAGSGSCTVGTATSVSALVPTCGGSGDDGSDGG